MSEQIRFNSEAVSMESGRDLRDYALVHGFDNARDFIAHLRYELEPGDTFLDMGCGSGRASAEAAKRLSPHGVRCLALDRNVPTRTHRSLKYIPGDFRDTTLDDESIQRMISVCALFMYAEDQKDLHSHVAEVSRVLAPSGKLSVVVDPVILLQRNYENQTFELSAKMRSIDARIVQEEASVRAEFADLRNELPPDRRKSQQLERKIKIDLRHRLREVYLRNLAEKVAIRRKIGALRQERQTDIAIGQRLARDVWVQSPTMVGRYFRTNLVNLLADVGLEVIDRIVPRGGNKIDDDITLVVTKTG